MNLIHTHSQSTSAILMAPQLEIDLRRLAQLIQVANESTQRHLQSDGSKASLVFEDIQSIIDKFRAINKRAGPFYFQDADTERCYEILLNIGEELRTLGITISELFREHNKHLYDPFNIDVQMLTNDIYWALGIFVAIMDCSLVEVEGFHQLVNCFKGLRDSVQYMKLKKGTL